MEPVTFASSPSMGLMSRLLAFQRKFSENRMVRAGVQMTGFRFLSLGVGAAGSIWAARCLGPEKTGISGVVLATSTQMALFATFNQDVGLIRRYKEMSDTVQQNGLIAGIVTQRILAAIILITLGWIAMWVSHVPSQFTVPALLGSALFFFTTNTPNWLLQARENMPAQYRMTALQACLSAALIAIFFRPGMPAGSDLAVTLVVTLVTSFFIWKIALLNRHSFSLSLDAAWTEAPLLWQGRWLFLTGLVVYLYTSSEQPILAYFGSVRQLGQYRSALQITGAIQPFLTMFAALLYPRYVEWHRAGPLHLWVMQVRIVKFMVVPLAVIGLLIAATVPKFQPLVFGEKFAPAAVPCVYLLLAKLVVVVNSVFSFGLWARKKDKATLAIMCGTAIISVLSNLLLVPRFGMLAAAMTNCASELIILMGTFTLTWWLVRQIRSEKQQRDPEQEG